MIPKSTQIEFGNLSRAANNPILIKEKTAENGDTILRIYQRKDLQSISNPFEKIKNTLKYTLEDFGREHETAAKLLEKIGFGKVRALTTQGIKEAAGLIETVRSGARTGLIDEESKTKFDNLLSDNNITNYSGFKFYEDTYSDENFKQDLIFIRQKINPEISLGRIDPFGYIPNYTPSQFIEDNLKTLESGNSIIQEIADIFNEVNMFLIKNNTNNQLREEFLKKLYKVFYDPMLIALGSENTKNWLLEHEGKLSKKLGNTDDQALIKSQEITINNIKTAFSSHWWDSDEKKIESLVALLYRYENSDDVPEIIKGYVFFSAQELMKNNPSLQKKYDELHVEEERKADHIKSEQEIQSMEDDKA